MGARNETEGQTGSWEIHTESDGNLNWSVFYRNPLPSAQQITETHRASYIKTGKNQLRKRAAGFQKLDKILGSQVLFSTWLKAPRAGQKPSLCLISPSWASVKKYKTYFSMSHCPQQTTKLSKSSCFFSPVLLMKGPCSEMHSFECHIVVSPISLHPIVREHCHWKLENVALSGGTKAEVGQLHHTSQCNTPIFRKECGPPADS